MLQNYTDLLPLRDYTEHSILPFYSLNGTGVGGRFVVLETGQQDPALSAGRYSNASAGASYTNTVNLRYENPRKYRFAQSGEGLQVIGLSLYGTVETDTNGQKILLDPTIAKELGVVISGQSSPIATAGYFRLKNSAYAGTPIPGYVGVIHDTQAGKVNFLAPSAVTDKSLVVCKVLSTSGTALNGGYGYVDVLLTLKG